MSPRAAFSLPLLLLACGRAPAPATPPTHPPEHGRMVALLQELASVTEIDNQFFGRRKLERLRAELAAAGPRATWRLRCETAIAELEQGHERQAIELLTATRDALRDGTLPGDAAAAIGTGFQLAVAWLRLGESENCCANPTEETCILPIRGTGRHARREGSEHALEYLAEVLRNTPEHDYWHYAALWLLNIAHMTLGSWPDGVPTAYRLPANAFAPETELPRWHNVAAAAGVDVVGTAGGVAVEDFDGDERLDVVVSDWAPRGQLRFFHNQGDGTFADRTTEAGLDGITGGLNLVHADHDGDGDVDVLVLRGGWWFETGRLPCSLLQNRGNGVFDDVTFAVGLADRREPTQTGGFADHDLDGDLDLYIGGSASQRVQCSSHLYRHDGDRYVDVSAAAGVENGRYCKAICWGDYDNDRWPDLYLSNIGGENRLYHNRGDGTFEDVAVAVGVTKPINSFPAWFWDFDNDGALDLFVSNYDTGIAHLASHLLGGKLPFERARLYRGDGKGGFRDVAAAQGLDAPWMPMGCSTGDLDGDGWLDVRLGTGDPQYASLMPNVMLRNVGGTRLQEVTMATGLGHLQKGHGVAFADFDHDGDQDLFEVIGGAYPGDAFRKALFANPGHGNRWLSLRLVGRESVRCAIGARVAVTVIEAGKPRVIRRHVGHATSFGGNTLRLEFGLGKAERIESVEILWPRTGATQRLRTVPMDRILRIVEGDDDAAVQVIDAPVGPLGGK